MSKRRRSRWLLGAMAVPVLAVLLACNGRLIAQDGAGAAKPAVEKKERAKPKGRLPAYFASVVSPAQREKIYALQARYEKQIDELQRQLDELEAQRDQEVDAVLTPEQLEKVNALREAAKAKRTKKGADSSDAPQK